MIKETANKNPQESANILYYIFFFKIHILSLKLTCQKGAKIDDVTG